MIFFHPGVLPNFFHRKDNTIRRMIRVMLNFRHLMLLGTIALVFYGQLLPDVADAMPQEDEKPPFILPFAKPPGPDTWLFQQPYGNTTFAYRFRQSSYWAGQGLHFGVDFAAPCGTPVLAIGDGIVHSIDNNHGAGPHNLMINHPNDYASFYGHLFVRSHLKIGQEVRAGEVVGLVGDPDLTCSSRPHLHLEIRDALSHRRAFNPLALIDADWERLALYGSHSLTFEQDMADPHRWQNLLDQPEIKFGDPLLNDYENPWPPAW